MNFQLLLNQLGIPIDREVEIYHNCRLNSGLHSYGAWYHFVGRILRGERELTPRVRLGSFAFFFHAHPELLNEAFAGKAVVQLEVDAEVPWLSDVPEIV